MLERHDEVFHRLLLDRRLRAQVRAGDWSSMDDVADDFRGIDMDELEKLASAIRLGLVRGSLGGLGIGAAFPSTVAALGGDANEVVERFLCATGGAALDGRAVDGTGRGAGISVLEAFHLWAAAELAARPSAVARAQHELAAALCTALTKTPRPGFRVEWPLVRPGPRGFTCVLDAARPLMGPHDPPEQPVVYVALGGRYATGRVSPPLAAVLLAATTHPPPWAIERLACIEPSSLDAIDGALAARGLR